MSSLLEQLSELPDHWGYVAVGHGKKPYQAEWQRNPLTKDQLAAEITAGRAVAVGVLAGPQSGGLLFVDHDGISAGEILAQLGTSLRELPKSWAMTSGRDGRLQIIYQVPEQYWPDIRTKKLKTGKLDDEGNSEQLELRWTGCQSVVLGAHPITGAYRWLKNRAPSDLPLADAPTVLVEAMLPQEPVYETQPLPPRPIQRTERTDSDWARIYLDALSPARADDHDNWIEVGMCLHSIGDPLLLYDWENWSQQSPKYKPRECEYRWNSFSADGKRNIGHLCNLAKQDGWQSKRLSLPPVTINSAPNSEAIKTSNGIKLDRLESHQLMAHLRPAPNKASDYRFNLFTQQIESKGKVIEGIERFYLTLAEQGYKVSKEMAIDCLVQVANEHPYDPVAEWLDDLGDKAANGQVLPAYIDRLASTYLRPDDAIHNSPTLYDHMLKATLIGAVKRVFEPGCKHDYACVLMGDQGARKSSFWSALGGAFFSDALRDISSKDDLMVLHRSWIMEWAELDHITSKKHAGQVKSFLSQSTDLFRVPYGKSTERFPRRCIIVGSTNKDTGFLVDDTGNRRFWVIPVTCTLANPIDVPNLLLECDAIWAAAVLAYRAKEPSCLSYEQEAQVADQNAAYVIDSPWKAHIETWLTAPYNQTKTVTTDLLLEEAIKKPVERQTKSDQMQIASIMRDLGYEKRRQIVHGVQKWVFLPTLLTSG